MAFPGCFPLLGQRPELPSPALTSRHTGGECLRRAGSAQRAYASATQEACGSADAGATLWPARKSRDGRLAAAACGVSHDGVAGKDFLPGHSIRMLRHS